MVNKFMLAAWLIETSKERYIVINVMTMDTYSPSSETRGLLNLLTMTARMEYAMCVSIAQSIPKWFPENDGIVYRQQLIFRLPQTIKCMDLLLNGRSEHKIYVWGHWWGHIKLYTHSYWVFLRK